MKHVQYASKSTAHGNGPVAISGSDKNIFAWFFSQTAMNKMLYI